MSNASSHSGGYVVYYMFTVVLNSMWREVSLGGKTDDSHVDSSVLIIVWSYTADVVCFWRASPCDILSFSGLCSMMPVCVLFT